jgi:Arc/MetJ-type ribon-helix-helix transcriptional regulator
MPIKKIKTVVRWHDGLFSDSRFKNISTVINELIQKSNEQTKVINHLTDELQRLKQKEVEAG